MCFVAMYCLCETSWNLVHIQIVRVSSSTIMCVWGFHLKSGLRRYAFWLMKCHMYENGFLPLCSVSRRYGNCQKNWRCRQAGRREEIYLAEEKVTQCFVLEKRKEKRCGSELCFLSTTRLCMMSMMMTFGRRRKWLQAILGSQFQKKRKDGKEAMGFDSVCVCMCV